MTDGGTPPSHRYHAGAVLVRPVAAPHRRTDARRLPLRQLRRLLHRHCPVCGECGCIFVPAAATPQQDTRAPGLTEFAAVCRKVQEQVSVTPPTPFPYIFKVFVYRKVPSHSTLALLLEAQDPTTRWQQLCIRFIFFDCFLLNKGFNILTTLVSYFSNGFLYVPGYKYLNDDFFYFILFYFSSVQAAVVFKYCLHRYHKSFANLQHYAIYKA